MGPQVIALDKGRVVKAAIDDLRSGRMVVVVGDDARGNEAAVIVAGEFATPGAINFMATEARGVVCLALTPERCDELALRPMVARNDSALGTAFTVSIEAREGVSTGISTSDRARTIAVAIDPASSPRTLYGPATSSRFAPVKVGSWSVRAGPSPAWTLPVSRA